MVTGYKRRLPDIRLAHEREDTCEVSLMLLFLLLLLLLLLFLTFTMLVSFSDLQ